MPAPEKKAVGPGDASNAPGSKAIRGLARAALGSSAALLVGVALCFLARWDVVAVITLPPFWAWGIVGLFLTTLGWWLARGGWQAPALLALWAGATLFFSDDIQGWLLSPLRSGLERSSPRTGVRLRVVSLNCAGQAKAAEEVGALKPDIVLLQESPSSNHVARLCREWFGSNGSFICGMDCSIITRGRLKVLASPRSLRFNWGEVTLLDGLIVDVVSLRLFPPETRFDLWSPECWRQHTHGRQIRRAQLQELTSLLQPIAGHRPMIVGGDFNAPAGDAIFRLLHPFLKDSFREAGQGWGNTGINDLPVSRPDQIWINQSSIAHHVQARKTEHSDHRMVVCDVVLPPWKNSQAPNSSQITK